MEKRRVLNSCSEHNHNIPEDLLPDILSRLPVKSLLRFRCISRSWRTLIGDSDFTRLHLSRFKNNGDESQLMVTQATSSRRVECMVRCSKTFSITTRFEFLQSNRESIDTLNTTYAYSRVHTWFAVSYIDGLFVLGKVRSPELMLWNPSIRKTLILPTSPGNFPFMINEDFGLGLDPSIKDYKLVRFLVMMVGGVHWVAVYTVGTNSWKRIAFRGHGCEYWRKGFRLMNARVCCKGVLYSLATTQLILDKDFHFKLVSFDLSSELFATIELPVVEDHNMIRSDSHVVTTIDGGSSLAVVDLWNAEGNIWVLDRAGADIESWGWTKRHSFAMVIPQHRLFPGCTIFVYLKKDGEMLLRWNDRLTFYNLNTDEQTTVVKKKFHDYHTWPYVESLLLL